MMSYLLKNIEFFSLVIVASTALICFVIEQFVPMHTRTIKQNINNTFFNIFFGTVSIFLSYIGISYVEVYAIKIQPFASLQNLDLVTQIVLCILIFDILTWSLHVMNHRFSFLWRWHSVHHSDLLLNTSSAIRFHTIEIFYSAVVHSIFIALTGFPIAVVLIYRTFFIVSNMFQHSNILLPYGLESKLAWFVVTPRYHHRHHSVVHVEQNSNFGSIFVFWDKLFLPRTQLSKIQFNYGLEPLQRKMNTLGLFFLPFKKKV